MITGHTRTFALLGHPVAHSASPHLHNAWFDHHGYDGVYVALTCRTSGERAARAIRDLGLAGANLTVPLKERVLPHLDHLHPTAAACGAVNTVVRRQGALHGFNTDADGFMDGLAELGIDPHARRVAILGAGGASRAVAWALHRSGAGPMRIFNRTSARADDLIQALDLAAQAAPLTPEAFAAWPAELVIHALPSAARRHVAALPLDGLAPDAVWCDLNYWDPDPPHATALRQGSVRFQTGHAMLLHQAARAFSEFTGVVPSIEVGRRALRRHGAALVSGPPAQ